MALGVGGRQRGTFLSASAVSPGTTYGPFDIDEKAHYGSDTENRRLDAGVNFGLGYRKGPLQVQLGYGLGLRNLHQRPLVNGFHDVASFHNFNADPGYNRVAQLTATYFLEL